MSNSGKVSSPVRIRPALTPYPNRNRFTDQSRKPAIQHLAQCLWNVLINMIIQVYVSFELLHENPSFGLVVSPSFCSGNTKMSVFSLIIPVIFPASTTFWETLSDFFTVPSDTLDFLNFLPADDAKAARTQSAAKWQPPPPVQEILCQI